ncbi:PREDICTED: myb-like protein A [Priapulus caudatus]|uniref:Myb-like protein A n=1 Tax=Priapulus caudatus TaxID=37621 RepID=A0ABM1EEH8_PRICU|nr:PREDICTED: myb-like protein A [Priapulus caudatus]
MLDREPTCIANYFRNHTPPKTSKQWTVGRWTREEEQMLLAGIKAVARTDDLLTTETKNLSWHRVATHVPGRTDVQCFARWEDSLHSKVYDTRFKVGKYSLARKKQHLQMLERIVELKPQSLCDINWAELALQFDVATNARILRSQFHRTKNRMVNPKKKSFEDVMGFIKTIFIPKLKTEIEVKLAKK